jgi:hypothetical protein
LICNPTKDCHQQQYNQQTYTKHETIKSELYSKAVTEIVPNFLVMSDSDKFKYILSSNDYDIMKICVIGISEISGLHYLYSEPNSFSSCSMLRAWRKTRKYQVCSLSVV